jgi:hypothetical protein
MAMDWVPVSKEKFEAILTDELETLRPEVIRLYEQYAVQPFQQPCVREENSGIEHVFVLAKKQQRLLYYDDVEEDFGVAILDGDGVLRNWGNYGPLVQSGVGSGRRFARRLVPTFTTPLIET